MILSICIPTYNRSKKVKNTITILVNQIKKFNLENDCELLISESTDKKIELLEKSFKIKNSKYVRFIRSKIKSDFEANLINLYFNSKGKYSWLLGDDDYIFEKTLVTIVKTIKNNKLSSSYITFRCSGKPGKSRSKKNDIYFQSLPNKINNSKLNYSNYVTLDGKEFVDNFWISTIFLSLCIFKTKEFLKYIKKDKIYLKVDPAYPHSNLLIPFIEKSNATVILDILLEDSYNLKYYNPRDKFVGLVSSWINFIYLLKYKFHTSKKAIYKMRKVAILQIIYMLKYSILLHMSQKKSNQMENIYKNYFDNSKKLSISKPSKELFVEYIFLKISLYIIILMNKNKNIAKIIINLAKFFDNEYFSKNSIKNFTREYNLVMNDKVTKVHYVN